MKLKLFIILFALVATFNIAVAQDGGEEAEGENFWTEEADTNVAEDGEIVVEENENASQPMPKPLTNFCSNRNELRDDARYKLSPYKYNMAKTTMIVIEEYAQRKLLIIPIYMSQRHRMVFSMKGMPEPYGIKVYNQHPEASKKAEVIFEGNKDEMINIFELPADYKEDYVFVEYTIPPSKIHDKTHTEKGCAVFFMGYLNVDDAEAAGTETEGTVGTD